MHLNSTCTDVKHASERVMQFSLYDCFPHAFSVPGVQLIKHGEIVNSMMAERKQGRTGSRRVVHCAHRSKFPWFFFSSATVASFPLTLRFTNWTPVTEWFTFY